VGSGREVHGKENPRKHYAVGLRTEPAHLVRGSSRRITIMRFRPANIRVINRRNSRLDRDLRCLLRKDGKKIRKKKKQKRYLTRSFHISVCPFLAATARRFAILRGLIPSQDCRRNFVFK